jgi:hypothetical protein
LSNGSREVRPASREQKQKKNNGKNMKNTAINSLGVALVTAMLLTTGLSSVKAQEPSVADRMLHHRAIDAAVWAMPLMNF